MAPESFNDNKYNEKSDIWVFLMTMFAIKERLT